MRSSIDKQKIDMNYKVATIKQQNKKEREVILDNVAAWLNTEILISLLSATKDHSQRHMERHLISRLKNNTMAHRQFASKSLSEWPNMIGQMHVYVQIQRIDKYTCNYKFSNWLPSLLLLQKPLLCQNL